MYGKYRDRAEFLLVYIHEAHPADSPRARKGGPNVNEARVYEDRVKAAKEFTKEIKLEIPMVLDEMDDRAGKAYGAWPDRIYIVGTDGKIAYRGGVGPKGFKPDELEKRLAEVLSRKK